MAAKRKTSEANKTQYERFVEKARELGVDESGEAFERAFKKIVPPKARSVSGKGKANRAVSKR